MYEHTYLMHHVSRIDLERQAVQLERARIARENPERLVPRRSWVDRMLRRPHPVAARPAAHAEPAAAGSASDPVPCAGGPSLVASELV